MPSRRPPEPARTRVALTFDAEHPDRPASTPTNAERILDLLGEAGVRATFFLQSRWAQANPSVARRIAEQGHLVGNHSTYHARMTLLTDDGVRTDVRQAEETIADLTGTDPRPWFRCPFGDGRDDPRVLGILGELGYRNVHWHVETEDWEPSRRPEEIARATAEGALSQGDGAVVLLHTWPDGTVQALAAALDALRQARAALVTVDELEALP
jgi:peptidoglycan/xylan/chitin deacetylase (PgdA/CDA1 family)